MQTVSRGRRSWLGKNAGDVVNRLLPAIIIALLLLGVFVVMWRAWQARRASTTASLWECELTWPERELLESVHPLFYVATTYHDRPLDRVLPPGLEFRGNARLDIYRDGVVIQVNGEKPFAIAGEKIRGYSVQQLTIDKVVERDGLVALQWESPFGVLSSVFRVKDDAQRYQLLSLNTPHTPAGDTLD